jgi:hypothetical protein
MLRQQPQVKRVMEENGRRSRLTRRLLVLAGFIFILLYLGILGVEWAFLRGYAVADAQEKAKTVTELFVLEFEATAPLSQFLEHLDEPDRYRALDNLVRHKLSKFGLQKCKIYDREGTILYADQASLVGMKFGEKRALRKALSGQPFSNVLSKSEYVNLYGVPARTSVVETYLPMAEASMAPIRYVFEAYQDFDPAQVRVWKTVLSSGASLAVILGLALTALTLSYRRIHRLEAHVETLESLLPICSYCKKIRVEKEGKQDQWVPVEAYFGDRDRVEFTHGMCRECVEEHFSEYMAKRKRQDPAAPEGA